MAPSILQYSDITDLRYNPFTRKFTPRLIGYGAEPAEVHTIPSSSPYIIQLFEAPQQNAPPTTVVEIGGVELTEVGEGVTPSKNQYRVIYYDKKGLGQIEFNSQQAGNEATVKYYGLGHIQQKILLDTRVPSTGNTTIAGNKTFSGNTIFNGSVTTQGVLSAESNVVAANLISQKIYLLSTGKITTGGETSPDCVVGGATLKTTGGRFLTVKLSDTHGITSVAETDTFLQIGVTYSTAFTLEHVNVGDAFSSYITYNENSDNFIAMCNFTQRKKNGTSYTDCDAYQIMYEIRNNITARLRVYGNGIITCIGVGFQTQYKTAAAAPSNSQLNTSYGITAGAGLNGLMGIYYDSNAGSHYFVAISNGAWHWVLLT